MVRQPRARLSAARRSALADRIRAARAAREWTQEQLAEAAGLTTEHLQRLERGAGNPTLATLYALADAFGIRPHELLP